MSKTKRILYWVFTAWLALGLISTGLALGLISTVWFRS